MALTVGPLSTQLWQCLAADAKPKASNAPQAPRINDALFEIDTCLWYVWNGDTWNCTTLTPPLAAKSGGTPPPMA